jgi:phosphatidylglycerophosphate synthase
MSARAIVLPPTTMTLDDLSRPIAGVPTLLRLLLSAQRAGIGEILLLGANRYPSAVQQSLTQDSRLVTRLIWLDDQPWSALLQACPELEKEWWESDLWILPAGGVIDVQLLRDAVRQPSTDAITVIDAWPRPSPHGKAAFFRVSGARLQPMVATSGDMALSSLLGDLPRREEIERIPNRGLVCAPAVSKAQRPAIERGLFRGLKSASDGWVDRYLNRNLSPWFSRWFLRLPLTPNHVTFVALTIGLLSAVCFAHGGWASNVIGALLLQWSAVIDCCDGEVARLKFLESTSGYYLDIACDNLVHIAVFGGIAWASYQDLGQTSSLLLGGLAAFGTTMAFLVVLTTRHGRPRMASATLDRLIDALANRDFSLIVVVCALTGTLQWFLWALAVGVNLFWPLVLGLARKAQRTAHG